MPPRRTTAGDPRLKTPEWRAIVAEWNRRRPTQCRAPTCLLPGQPIRYGGKRGPAHLDVGHILDRELDPRQTWTITDTRPEHARCNRTAGTNKTNAKRKATARRRRATTPTLVIDDW